MLQGFATHRAGKFYADLAADGPVAFYHLEQLSGAFTDLGSNGFDLPTTSTSGLTRGVSTIIPSEHSKAVTSAGATEIGQVASNLFFINTAQPLTIVHTIKTPLPAGGQIYAMLHQGNDANAGNQGLMHYITDTGAYGIQVFSGGFQTAQTAGGLISANTATLSVIVIDPVNSQIRVYVQGVLVSTLPWTFGTGSGLGANTFTAGAYVSNTPQAPFVGTYQGLAIYDKVISGARITQYYTDWQ